MAEINLTTSGDRLKNFFQTPIVTVLASIVCTFVLAALFFRLIGPVPVSITQTTVQKDQAFQVTGEGTAPAVPDEAQISLGITVTKSTVKAAKDEANQIINQIGESLKKLGVGKEDIKTTNYSVNPQYVYQGTANPRVTGYTVNATLGVTFKDFDNLNSAIDQATALGANQVGGINFTLSDETRQKAEDQARQEAVRQAKQKADSLAKASGIKLGKLINVIESPGYTPGPMPMYARAESLDSIGVGEPTQIEPGSQEVHLSVTLSYETL